MTTAPTVELRPNDLWPGMVIIETLQDADGLPMTAHDAVNFETGVIHPDVLSRMPMALDVHLSADGVRIKRYITRGEVVNAAKEVEGR
ncbi:MAG: hypothetical protein ACTSX8_09090 [Alphaproteobacteria bacterium]